MSEPILRAGLSSWAFPWAVGVDGHLPERPMEATDLISRAASWEVPVVQIADNMPLHHLDERQLAIVRDQADRDSVDIEVGMAGFAVPLLETYIRIAAHMRSAMLRVVIDTPADQPDAAEIVRRICAIIPSLERSGISLLIENHDRFRSRELSEILRTVEHPNVGICYDTVNSLGVPETGEQLFDELRPYIGNIHVKDYDIRRVANRMGFEISGATAGQGKIDLQGLVQKASRLRRPVTLVLEQWPRWEGNIVATIAAELASARAGLVALRAAIGRLATGSR